MTPVPDARTVLLLADLTRSELTGPHVQRLADLLRTADEPYRRTTYLPGHVTGSAFLLSPSEDAVALVHHLKLGIWVQPGGHLEDTDRSVEHGARRELAEEVRVEAVDALGLVDVDVHRFPEVAGQPAHSHFDVRYLFRARDRRLIAGDGVAEVRWVPVAEALEMDESIARAVRAIVAGR